VELEDWKVLLELRVGGWVDDEREEGCDIVDGVEVRSCRCVLCWTQ
jgi:hypothetical protein